MTLLTKLRYIFDRKTKFRLVALLLGVMFSGFLEIAALSIVSPLIGVIMEPGMVEATPILAAIYNGLGFASHGPFLALLAGSLAFLYAFRGAFVYFFNKAQYRFLGALQVSLSSRILRRILYKPYLYHADHNIAELQRLVLRDVEMIVYLMTSVLFLITDVVIALFIVVFLFVISWKITLCVMGLAIACVLVYIKVFRGKAQKAGDDARENYILMTKAVNQALGGIKEVKVLRREGFFQNAFKKNSDKYIVAYQYSQLLSTMPKTVIESVCFSGAFLFICAMLASGYELYSMVPQLATFVLAAFRLLPSVSRTMSYYSDILYRKSAVNSVYASLYEDDGYGTDEDTLRAAPKTQAQQAQNDAVLYVKNLTFHYPNAPEATLENVSLEIPPRKSVAFIGPSGAGKTTLADIVLGLLTPSAGSVYYGEQSIHAIPLQWANSVGYIPQQIYLLDETILENVTFGIPPEEVEQTRVRRALEQAQLWPFIETLPEGMHTIVGDRGIRLSGGQRQRIGIARALYKDPPILVLDEATSSLDDDTETAVMEAIQGLQGEKTLVIIAHRLSTITHCDIVYRVEEKTVVRER